LHGVIAINLFVALPIVRPQVEHKNDDQVEHDDDVTVPSSYNGETTGREQRLSLSFRIVSCFAFVGYNIKREASLGGFLTKVFLSNYEDD
jgi:hypothetical protein